MDLLSPAWFNVSRRRSSTVLPLLTFNRLFAILVSLDLSLKCGLQMEMMVSQQGLSRRGHQKFLRFSLYVSVGLQGSSARGFRRPALRLAELAQDATRFPVYSSSLENSFTLLDELAFSRRACGGSQQPTSVLSALGNVRLVTTRLFTSCLCISVLWRKFWLCTLLFGHGKLFLHVRIDSVL